VVEVLEGLDVRIDGFRVDDDRDGRHVAFDVAVPDDHRQAVVPALARLDEVTSVRWSA
jgi:hypothetical protein